MSKYAVFNGTFLAENDIKISPDNRSFRYGDGCFETIKILDNKIILEHLHFERLFLSLQKLEFDLPETFTKDLLSKLVIQLAEKNNHHIAARIRLTVFRAEGQNLDINDFTPRYIIQSWPLDTSSLQLNNKGLEIGIFPFSRKTTDFYSNIKSNNYLPYIMASIWAKRNAADDCLLLNTNNLIADSCVANVFIVDNGIIKTPSLSNGCVAGVMRQHIINESQLQNIELIETDLSIQDICNAHEVFLTNANYGLRWVEKMQQYRYSNELSRVIYSTIITPLFDGKTF